MLSNSIELVDRHLAQNVSIDITQQMVRIDSTNGKEADLGNRLAAQLELDAEGHPGAAEPGHAAVRFTNPTTGADALTTLRTEMHRLAPGARTAATREVGSSVWQVFDGDGHISLDQVRTTISRGDVIAVPSWCELAIEAGGRLDLFRFSDTPVFEKLNLARRITT